MFPVEIISVPPWLNAMPLDSPDHVRQAWHMIGHPSVRAHLIQLNGLSREEAVAVIGVMRRRIRKAAWEHGVVLFGE
jgi:hypothetical protein